MAGENENSIGTARAYLDIDTQGWDQAVAQSINKAAGLGTAAEEAFDKSSAAAKRAATQLILYGKTTDETTAKQAALIAVAKGVPVSVAQAWAKAAQSQIDATKAAESEQIKLNALMEEAIAINKAMDIQLAQNAQNRINQALGINLNPGASAGRQADAISAFSTLPSNDELAAAKLAEETKALEAHYKALKARDDAAFDAAQPIRGLGAASTVEADGAALAARAEREAAKASTEAAAAARAQQAALGKLMGQIDPTVAKLQKLDAMQAKLTAAHAKGQIGEADFAAYNAVLEKNRTEITNSAGAMSKLNFNTAQARREYGYLIKDVATGQWGRFQMSAATLANNIGGLGIKFIALVGAMALVSAAFISASKEWDKFVASVAEGNGLSGTIDELDKLVHSLAVIDSNRLSAARTAVEGLAKAGLLSGENFEMAARAATDWASATGESADKIISKFNEIATDPMKAITDGTVRVNEEQLNTINNLLAMGMHQEAVNEVTRLYFSQIESNSQMVKDNMSEWGKLTMNLGHSWDSAKESAAGYLNLVLGMATMPRSKDWGILPNISAVLGLGGNPILNAQMLGMLRGAQETGPTKQWDGKFIMGGEGGPTDGVLDKQTISLIDSITKAMDAAGTPTQKFGNAVRILNAQLDQLSKKSPAFLEQNGITRGADGSYSGGGYDKLITSYRKTYGLDAANKRGNTDENAAIKADMAAQQAQIAAQTAFLQGQYEQRQLSIEDYYTKLKLLAQDSASVEITGINKQIQADKAHGASKEKIAALYSQMEKAAEASAKKLTDLDNQEQKAILARTDATRAYIEAQTNQTTALERSLNAMVSRVGMGTQEYEIAQKINDEYNKQADALTALNREQAQNPNKLDYDKARNEVLQQTAARINDITTSYQKLNAVQLDVTNGMQTAWKDFAQKSMNLSDNFQSIWTTGLNAIGEKAALTATGVGTSFTQMGQQIEAAAIKALTNAAVTQFIKLIASYFGGSSMSMMGNGTGGYGMQTQASNDWNFGGLAVNAKGGMYDSPDLSKHLNSVLSAPTFFKFAKGGALGVAGEAGNEAIMPLSRDSNGVLGVRNYAGGGGAMQPVFNINVTGGSGQADVNTRRNNEGGFDIDVIMRQVDQGIAAGISNGTNQTGVAVKKRFGLRG